MRFFVRILAALSLIVLVLVAYLLWARPYQLRWGATDAEISRPMPGDELDPHPLFLATRAITIDGTPQEIWPWLLQMGYGRAGFYGYDLMENVGSPRGLRSADRILPEFQHFTVGDVVPISPVSRMVFYAIEPGQYVIWAGEAGPVPGGFTWALYPAGQNQTRLISRMRWSFHVTQPGVLALEMFTEVADHVAVRKILQGVKERVEGHIEPVVQQNVELGTYAAALLIFLAALVLLLLRSLTWQRWLAGLAAGAAWLITWYAPVPIWVGMAMELLVLGGVILAFHEAPVQRPTDTSQAVGQRPAPTL